MEDWNLSSQCYLDITRIRNELDSRYQHIIVYRYKDGLWTQLHEFVYVYIDKFVILLEMGVGTMWSVLNFEATPIS